MYRSSQTDICASNAPPGSKLDGFGKLHCHAHLDVVVTEDENFQIACDSASSEEFCQRELGTCGDE